MPGRTHDGQRLKLGPVTVDPDGPLLEPGELAVAKQSVHVGTGSTPVRLGEVRPFGKRQMPAADWARGVSTDGVRLGS